MSDQSLTTLEEVADRIWAGYQYLTIDETTEGKRSAYISTYKPKYLGNLLAGFSHYWDLMVPYINADKLDVAPSLIASLDPSICYDLYNYQSKE